MTKMMTSREVILRSKEVLIRDERGMTLLIVMVISVLFVVLSLTMTLNSMTDFAISRELQNKKMAQLAADAGVAVAKNTLEGALLDTVLATSIDVPQYITYSVPNTGTDAETYFNRNPIAPMEAMNVDFDSPPAQIGTRSVAGLLTSPSGDTLPSGGRYWAKVTDNDDGDGNLTTDQDGEVYLRVLAVQSIGAGQISTFGGTVKNTVAIVETTFKTDGTFNLTAPLTFVSPDLDAYVDGDNWEIHGYDHPAMDLNDLINDNHSHVTGGTLAGINLIYDNFPIDAQWGEVSLYTDMTLTQKENIEGDESDYGNTSIQDATQEVRANPDADAEQIFDPAYVADFLSAIASTADFTVTDGGINTSDLGTEADPKVTYCSGFCAIESGDTVQGAGLLVIDGGSSGELDIEGQFTFRGMVIVNGAELDFDDGSEVRILGSLVHFLTDGTTFGIPRLEVDVAAISSKLYFQKSAIQLGLSLLPLKMQSRREITPDVEPAF